MPKTLTELNHRTWWACDEADQWMDVRKRFGSLYRRSCISKMKYTI